MEIFIENYKFWAWEKSICFSQDAWFIICNEHLLHIAPRKHRNVKFVFLQVSHQSCKKKKNPLYLPHTCKQLLFQLQMHLQLNLEKQNSFRRTR